MQQCEMEHLKGVGCLMGDYPPQIVDSLMESLKCKTKIKTDDCGMYAIPMSYSVNLEDKPAPVVFNDKKNLVMFLVRSFIITI